MHNWLLQHFSQKYDLACHTTNVVCINFIYKWPDLQFNIDSERQIFKKLFSWQVYLILEILPEICGEVTAVWMTDLVYESRLYI